MVDEQEAAPATGPLSFGLAIGETHAGRARAHIDQEGRPSRAFLELAAASLMTMMPDPVAATRISAGLAEAHDLQTSMPAMAIVEQRACEAGDVVATVGLANAGSSTHVTVSMSRAYLTPEAAVEMAAALIYQAGAARAVHDLERGHVSSVSKRLEPRERPR